MFQKIIYSNKGLGLLTQTDQKEHGWPFRRRLSVIVGDSVFTREDGQMVCHDQRAVSKILSQIIILTWEAGELEGIIAACYDPQEEVNYFTFKICLTRFRVYVDQVDEHEVEVLISLAEKTHLNEEATRLIKEEIEACY